MKGNEWRLRIVEVLRCSWIYYILVTVILATAVDWTGAKNERLMYLMGMAGTLEYQDPRENVLYFEQNISLHPQDALTWRLLGVSYYNLGDYSQAERCFGRAFQFSAGSAQDAGLIDLARATRAGRPPELLSISSSPAP